MTSETRIGLIVGLCFVAVFAWLLDDVRRTEFLSQHVPDIVSTQALDLVALLVADLFEGRAPRERS